MRTLVTTICILCAAILLVSPRDGICVPGPMSTRVGANHAILQLARFCDSSAVACGTYAYS